MYGPDLVRHLCDELSRETDEVRCGRLIAILRAAVAEDGEELRTRVSFLARRYLGMGAAVAHESSKLTVSGHGPRRGIVIVLKGTTRGSSPLPSDLQEIL